MEVELDEVFFQDLDLGLYWQKQHPWCPFSFSWESSVNQKLLLKTNKGFVYKQEGSVRKPVLHELSRNIMVSLDFIWSEFGLRSLIIIAKLYLHVG